MRGRLPSKSAAGSGAIRRCRCRRRNSDTLLTSATIRRARLTAIITTTTKRKEAQHCKLTCQRNEMKTMRAALYTRGIRSRRRSAAKRRVAAGRKTSRSCGTLFARAYLEYDRLSSEILTLRQRRKHVWDTDAIHPTFNLLGANTGRITVSDPAMQNVPPIRNPAGCTGLRPAWCLCRGIFRRLSCGLPHNFQEIP